MLKAVVIGLGALIVIALAFVAIGIVSKLGGHGAAQPSDAFALAPGAKIVEMQSEPTRLILRVRTEQGDEVDIVDTDDGHLVARIK
jgi:hypothetical protein